MPEETTVPENTSNYTPTFTLPALDILKADDFDKWLVIIKDTIYYLKETRDKSDNIRKIIDEAIERNQITETISQLDSKDYNEYTSNGVYYIPFITGTTLNYPSKHNYMLYVAANSDFIAQFAFNVSASTPALWIRNGKKTEDNYTFSNWYEEATKNWVTTNFLNKVQANTPQTVNSEVTFNEQLNAISNFNVSGNSTFNGVIYQYPNLSSENGIKAYNSDEEYSIEVNKDDHSNNFVLYKEYAEYDKNGNKLPINTEYQKPLTINYDTELCNINGTANYANYVNPEYMTNEFEASKITGNYKNYPVTGKALAGLYTFCEDTYMPYSGGSFTGIVNHNEDIFLRYIKDINSNRTAALRSPDGQLNLQCQQITNLISTSKQCEMYLEKEDVDSDEYTKNNATFNFDYYNVKWNTVKIVNDNFIEENNEEITILETTEDTIVVETSIGDIYLESDGNFIFAGNDETGRNINRNIEYTVKLFYDVVNLFNGKSTNVSVNNEYTFKVNKASGNRFNSIVSINSSHYEIVFTKSDFKGLPIVSNSTLRENSILEDGSIIAVNSHLNGYTYNTNEVVHGTIISLIKDSGGNIIDTSIYDGSILKMGTHLANGSVLNGKTIAIAGGRDLEQDYIIKTTCAITNDKFVLLNLNDELKTEEITYSIIKNLDGTIIELSYGTDEKIEVIDNKFTVGTESYVIEENIVRNEKAFRTILLPGSIIESGSLITENSIVNGVIYETDEIIDGFKLTFNDNVLAKGSYLTIGSTISANSIVNSSNISKYGIEIKRESTISTGSILVAGSIISGGSIVNNTNYDNPISIPGDIVIVSQSVLAPGSFIKSSSTIAGSSRINGIEYSVKFVVNVQTYLDKLTTANIAPKMYIATYDNVKDKYSGWNEYSFDKWFPDNEYNKENIEELWQPKIEEILSRLDTQEAIINEIIEDLPRILNENQEELPYPEINDLRPPTLYVGKYTASKTAENNPQNVYDEYVYVCSVDKSIDLDSIKIQIIPVPERDESTKPVDGSYYTIYSNNTDETVNLKIKSDIFEYSNFDVRKAGSRYRISFDYVLARTLNQYPENVEEFSEKIKFTFYAPDIATEFATEELNVAMDAKHMINSSCIIGARTRTGITKEGELGDPLYDLGCVEFGEDYTAIKLRKRNVTTLENIKPDLGVLLERNSFKPIYTEYLTNAEYYQYLLDHNVPESEIPRNIKENIDSPYRFARNISGIISLGTADSKFDVIYTNTSSIETSDKTQKTSIDEIPSTLLDSWKNVKWVTYKLKDSVEKKGNDARIHTGVIAQDLEKTLSNIDIEKYGFFCKDSWDNKYDTEYITTPAYTDEFGIEREEKVEKIQVVTQEKGEQYSIRYQEMQAIENMYLRREIELLKKELKTISQKLNN